MQDEPANTIIVTLTSINAEIAERQQYKVDQEAIIAGIINDGNNYLLGINYEIELRKRELKELKAKLYELARDRYQAEQDLKQLREDISRELKQSGLSPSFGV